MNSREILANYVLENVGESALIDMALQALAEGYDSPALRVLAGENPDDFNAFDVREQVRRVLTELNWSLPSPPEAARVLLCYWARSIVNGRVTPKEGAGHITHEVYMRIGAQRQETHLEECLDVSELMGLYYTYDDLQEGFIEYQGKPLTKAEAWKILDSEVLKAAHRYLQEQCAEDLPLIDAPPKVTGFIKGGCLRSDSQGCDMTRKLKNLSNIRNNERIEIRHASWGCFHHYEDVFGISGPVPLVVDVHRLHPDGGTGALDIVEEKGTVVLTATDIDKANRFIAHYLKISSQEEPPPPTVVSTTEDIIRLIWYRDGEILEERRIRKYSGTFPFLSDLLSRTKTK